MPAKPSTLRLPKLRTRDELIKVPQPDWGN